MSTTEVWRPIRGYSGRYEVSDRGRVRSWVNNHGRWREEPKLLALFPMRGYASVSLRKKAARAARRHVVHRLVLFAFRGAPPTRAHQGAHLNGRRHDARLVNLVWATGRENHAHKAIYGVAPVGENAPNARLREIDVKKIRASAESDQALSKIFGVSRRQINAIRNFKSWGSVR